MEDFGPFQGLVVAANSGGGEPLDLAEALERAFQNGDSVTLNKDVVLLIADRIKTLSHTLLGAGGAWQ